MKCTYCRSDDKKTHMCCYNDKKKEESHFFCKSCTLYILKRFYECPFCDNILVMKCLHTNCDWKENILLYSHHCIKKHKKNEIPLEIDISSLPPLPLHSPPTSPDT